MTTVAWEDGALNELADAWMRADSVERQRILSATSQVEQRLRANPATEGESRPEGRRVFFAPPLGVLYHFLNDRQAVAILRVWTIRKRTT
jgi:hypothetical protein